MQVQVDTKAVELAVGPGIFTLRNATATTSLWLDTGTAAGIQEGTVSPSTGFEWKPTDPLVVVEIEQDHALFAISGGAVQNVEVIKGVRFSSADVLVVNG